MKVLMFGWEFPPFKSGGLGTACHDLTKGLAGQDVDVTFVMPTLPEKAEADFVKLVGANKFFKNIKIKKIDSILTPYMTSDSYSEEYMRVAKGTGMNSKNIYGENLCHEVYRYSLVGAEVAKTVAEEEGVDVIHAHDWMTYKAGINARKEIKKPLVVHIHATEYDRTGNNPNSYIAEMEKEGLEQADVVIANSNFTKNNVINCYDIDPEKIQVVHWGIDQDRPEYHLDEENPFPEDKVVLFAGRITIQKGPDYFVEAARKVLDYEPNTKFVVVGEGHMMPQIISKASDYGILDKFVFTGWLKGEAVHKAFQMADLYVMPSVSEPFGLVALESLKNNTPILISKQSGVSEVVDHALKVDFWDVDEMANKIVNVLRYGALMDDLKDNSFNEVQKFNLDEPARKCKNIYMETIKRGIL